MGGHPRTFQFHACFVAIFFFIHLLHFSTVVKASNNGGFSVKLIRKELARTTSPYSRRLMDSSKVVQSTSNAYLGHYLMELSIGTPPKTIYGIADTGSDLIWTQCVPCHNCYKQLNPMFDPQQSSTYTNISCESEACHILDTTTLCSSSSFSSHNDQCNYTYAYASASITQGVLAHEKFTFTSTMGQPISLEGVVFGCGHSNSGDFNDHEMGIIGLGKGPASLISQMGSSFGSKRFSQCLVPFNTDIDVYSKLSFGNGSEVLGEGVVSTPLVTKADDTTPYFVTLLGITVGNTYLPFSNTSSGTVAKGNMFIDSGTPPTILPQDLYDRVVAQMSNQIALRPIEDDHDLGSQLCYRTETIVGGPMIIAHFEGADVQLTQTQIFVPPKDGVQCLGFTNTSSDGGIYAYNPGFSVQLIRKNSSYSPFSISNHFHKHKHRHLPFSRVPKKPLASGPFTRVISNNGDFLMKLSLGSPPVEIYGLIDTGSDLVWTQCIPCNNCYKQKNPMFEPQRSGTYSSIPCDSEECNLVPGQTCSPQKLCGYSYGYADSSVTQGVLSRETTTFSSTNGDSTVVEGIVFGCGHKNTGTFNENDMGIIGLGGGPLSLVSQVGAKYGGRRFSQCLVPFHTDPNSSGTISFGEASDVSGEGVVTTPLVSAEEELKMQINLRPVLDDPDLGTQLCYKSETNLEGPILTAHFDGADVQLMPIQTFISPKDGVFCFAMAGANDGEYIFGNFAQANILIGFDLDKRIVSFKPADCTKQ
ncbi:hypothetical protein Ahy_B05g078775 [Arachis hypogaea]|uniref:Peptidase A1 domain-containing protein n=1 Tax=Arachis hypogaea TaxID=3818 RepID=A0A444Z809_ARAHY|nr:hypothetical protein Ahy_B05g078775 [Arachis hypogaea]